MVLVMFASVAHWIASATKHRLEPIAAKWKPKLSGAGKCSINFYA
jgi:hypothetical protein